MRAASGAGISGSLMRVGSETTYTRLLLAVTLPVRSGRLFVCRNGDGKLEIQRLIWGQRQAAKGPEVLIANFSSGGIGCT